MGATILFDFDGTLSDSVSLGLALVNAYAGEFGYRELDCGLARKLSAMQLLRAAAIPLWKLPYLIHFFRRKLAEQAEKLQLFPGVGELLAALRASGFELGILTSNSARTVSVFLKKHGIESYFSYIRASVPLFGKTRAIRLAQRQLKPPLIYVGDELRDVDACRRTGIPIVSVAWGFNTTDVLRSRNPGFVAETAAEALALLKTAAAHCDGGKP